MGLLGIAVPGGKGRCAAGFLLRHRWVLGLGTMVPPPSLHSHPLHSQQNPFIIPTMLLFQQLPLMSSVTAGQCVSHHTITQPTGPDEI